MNKQPHRYTCRSPQISPLTPAPSHALIVQPACRPTSCVDRRVGPAAGNSHRHSRVLVHTMPQLALLPLALQVRSGSRSNDQSALLRRQMQAAERMQPCRLTNVQQAGACRAPQPLAQHQALDLESRPHVNPSPVSKERKM